MKNKELQIARDNVSTLMNGKFSFDAEQKIRELKSRIAKLNAQELKLLSIKTISCSASNINSVQDEKDGLSPDEIEKNLYLVKNLEHFLFFTE